ncbi:MAG: hypothetical protein AAF467_21105 [Actinomycetota bacterium]
MRRPIGAVAAALGVVGSLICVVGMVVAVWFGATASSVVSRTVDRVTAPIDRLDARLAETVAAIDSVDRAGELQARAQGVHDLAATATDGLDVIDSHPVLGRLPVDTSPVAELLTDIETTTAAAVDDLGSTDPDSTVPAAVRTGVSTQLDDARTRLSAVDERIEDVGATLRWWVRALAFVVALVFGWGLWGQVLLARHGWRSLATGRRHGRVEDREREEPDEITPANAAV